MWSLRQQEKREIERVAASQAIEVLEGEGYVRREDGNDGVLLEKPGTRFSTSVKKLPMKAWVMERDGSLDLWLRYGTICVNTGDLDPEADRLAEAIAGARAEGG